MNFDWVMQRQRLSVAEAGEYLRCNGDHVYHLIKAGELRKLAERLIRLDRQSLIDFRKRRKHPGKTGCDGAPEATNGACNGVAKEPQARTPVDRPSQALAGRTAK